MKFQKLSENKLKIILSIDELTPNEQFEDFIANSDEAKRSISRILDKAYSEVGFDTTDYKIKIDASIMKNGKCIFTITRLTQLNEFPKVAKPHRVLKASNIDSNLAIYKFETFEDFCSFATFLKKNKVTNLRYFAKSFSLYTYLNNCYLVITDINDNYKFSAKFYSCVTEFSKYFSSKILFLSVLQEKGTILIAKNAISVCQKHFKD